VTGLNLDPAEESVLDTLRHGCGLDANPREWVGCQEKRRAVERLVKRGLVRLAKSTPWAKHGTFVLNKEVKDG
jgi:hypothetical protein